MNGRKTKILIGGLLIAGFMATWPLVLMNRAKSLSTKQDILIFAKSNNLAYTDANSRINLTIPIFKIPFFRKYSTLHYLIDEFGGASIESVSGSVDAL